MHDPSFQGIERLIRDRLESGLTGYFGGEVGLGSGLGYVGPLRAIGIELVRRGPSVPSPP